MDQGILVGSDRRQEWLLSWWWNLYKEENVLPVAFADFGMSDEGKKWCRERGVLIEIVAEGYRAALPDEIEPQVRLDWEEALSPFWKSREAWFKKPFALLKTPFRQTVWLDLDCEVLGNLESIYEYIDPKTKLGLMPVSYAERKKGALLYNSGVIVFERDSPVLAEWGALSMSGTHRFLSDQEALSDLLFEKNWKAAPLPERYNWLMCRGVPLKAVILHWAAEWGKEYIRLYGGLKKELPLFSLL